MDVEMSEATDRLREDLTCPVCQSIFRDPVLLPCTHSFCRECLQRSLQINKKCPMCRKEFEEGQELTNRNLRDACENFLQGFNTQPTQKTESKDICYSHLKPLELYCEKDEEALCVECTSQHSYHRVLNLRDGATICKRELGYRVQIFEKKVDSYKKMTHNINNAVLYVKQQAGQAEEQIKAEFERLRQVLNNEETRRLRVLASEEEDKIAALNELHEKTKKDIVALKELVDSLKKEMGNEDLPLILKFKDLKGKSRWAGEDPRITENDLINMSEHVGGLSFKIWKKLQSHVKYNPVVFNPNTASPWLSLSADLTSVKESSERLTTPDNPERFEPCIFVLGAEGYTSGKHKWDINVGDNPKWVVGVCNESVARKKKFTVSTNRGVWSIALTKGVYTALTPERQELQVQQRPETIRVKLNIDKGEVSFWDGGTAKHLVTLTHKFDERMYPIFGPGLHNTPMILTPGKVAVHTS